MITFPRHDLYTRASAQSWKQSERASRRAWATALLALLPSGKGKQERLFLQPHGSTCKKFPFFSTFLRWLITRLSLRIILVFYYIQHRGSVGFFHSKKQTKTGRSSAVVSRLSGAPAGRGPAAAGRCSSHSLSRRLIDFMPVHEQAPAFPPAPPLFTAQHQILLVLSLY